MFEHVESIIPKDAVADTPVFLLATAGMRLLTDRQQDKLLNEVCKYTKASTSFLVTDCDHHFKVIPGETEGLYGWLAANYLLGGFDSQSPDDVKDKHSTYGFLDMGGASAQIAFAPNVTESEKHADDLKLVRLRTVEGEVKEYRVFVTTWLGYGANQARHRYVEGLLNATNDDNTKQLKDPCLPKGLTISTKGDVLLPGDAVKGNKKPSLLGTGDFPSCLNKTYPLLDKDAPCSNEPCLFNGSHVPLIDFDVNHFVGVSEYWHTTHQIFQYGHKEKAYDFNTYQTRVNEFCSKDWTNIAQSVKDNEWGKKVDEQTAVEVCFKASWLINVLHEGIGIPRTGLEDTPAPAGGSNGTKEVLDAANEKGFTESFHAVDEIAKTDVSWTLGKALLYASSQINAGDPGLPVGFGNNTIDGPKIPEGFQYAALPFTSSDESAGTTIPSLSNNTSTTTPIPIPTPPAPSPTSPDTTTPTSKPSSSSWKTLHSLPTHRVPGLLLFSLIAFLLIFFLLGRNHRTKLFHRLTGRSSGLPPPGSSSSVGYRKPPAHPGARSGRPTFVKSLLPSFLRPGSSSSSGPAYSRVGGTRVGPADEVEDLEAADFELGSFADIDAAPTHEPQHEGEASSSDDSTRGGSKGLASGWASPNLAKSRSEVDFGRGGLGGRGVRAGAGGRGMKTRRE